MNYFKELDINSDDVSLQLLNYIKKQNKGYIQGFWTNSDTDDLLKSVPDLQKLFDHLNITIKKISFVTAVLKKGVIHIDDIDTAPNARINIPILNCEDTETIFYNSTVKPKLMELPSGIKYYGLEDMHCQKVASFTLRKPTIIRPKELHQVNINSNNTPRISCTIEFYENIETLL